MKLCLGTVQFGLDYSIKRAGQPSQEESLEMLDAALKSGIYSIDTAAAYGTAEEVVGIFISKNPEIRDKLEITTKLASDALNNIKEEHYAETIRENLIQSLQKLNTIYLDNYLLHNPAHLNEEAIIKALFDLKKEGLTKNIGASIYTPDEAKMGIKANLDALQIPFSVFDQRMAESGVLVQAQNQGVRLDARSVFTKGLMLMEEDEIPAYLSEAKPVIKKLTQFCNDNGVTKLQLALAFISTEQSISNIVFGIDSKEQLAEILESYNKPVSDKVLQEAACQFVGLDESLILPIHWRK